MVFILVPPETKIWVKQTDLRGNPRGLWQLSWGVRQGDERSQYPCYQVLQDAGAPSPWGVLGDSTEHTLELPINSLPIIASWLFSGHELPHTSVLCRAQQAARTERVTGLLCVVVSTKGMWTGHKQYPRHCLPACSLLTQRPGITSQSVNMMLAHLFNDKGMWMVLNTSLAYCSRQR